MIRFQKGKLCFSSKMQIIRKITELSCPSKFRSPGQKRRHFCYFSRTDLSVSYGKSVKELYMKTKDARNLFKKKMNLYFTLEFHSCIDLFSALIALRTYLN